MLLRKYYVFKKLPNNYFRNKSKLPSLSTKIKTQGRYTFPIKNKNEAARFIRKIESEYTLPRVMPLNFIEINYTNKSNLDKLKKSNSSTNNANTSVNGIKRYEGL
ncbi:21469_t:CDS:2 [Gigaspora rosea]|nr:21469_t:CDS:2 [Gigaspora rosea]